MKISMKEIKEFYFDNEMIKIKTENTPFLGRIYKFDDDDTPLTKKQLEARYVRDKNKK